MTAFHVACSQGHLKIVVLLIQKGINVHHKTEARDEMTPLILAAKAGHYGVVRYLLEMGKCDEYT